MEQAFDVAEAHAPIKKKKVKGISAPWLDNKVLDHYRKALKSNSSYHWNMYKKLRSLVNKLIKSSKSDYYCDLIEESKGDCRAIWNAVNEASQRCKHKEFCPQCITVNEVKHIDCKSIANTLNIHFFSREKACSEIHLMSLLNYQHLCHRERGELSAKGSA